MSLFPQAPGANGYSITMPQFQVPQFNMPTVPTPSIQGPQLNRVNGINGAKAYPTVANAMYALFDENDDILYVKITDAGNYPTIRTFKMVEEVETSGQESKYVTIDEFNKFKEELLNGKQFVRADKSASNWNAAKPNRQNKANDGNAKE